MTDKCIDCEHYLLQQTSVNLDITNDIVTATARYTCLKDAKPTSCVYYSKALIEDSIVWKRGSEDVDDE
jgi:hypothetical protein